MSGLPTFVRPRGRVTLKDVAEEVGVSVNTVSRALTGKPDVGPETRARVRQAAERLDYTPNLLARSLVQGRTRTVGLVVTDCTNAFYATLIRAVEETVSRYGYGLLLATANEDPTKEAAGLRLLQERRIDGLLLSPVRVEAPHVAALAAEQIPHVLLSRRPAGYRGYFVGTDNLRGARLAVAHLVELGHRRIAHLSRADTVSSAVERIQGYRSELQGHGIAFDTDLVLTAPATVTGGAEAVPHLLGLNPRPSAIFAYSDLQAIGLQLALRDAGLRVPEDVSIIGFDGIELASYVSPPLTTIAQDIPRIGALGAEILVTQLTGTAPQRRSRLLRPKLVVRGSTAPVHA
jgi:LacI family transcriptional regulator